MGQPPTVGSCNVTSYRGGLRGGLPPRELAMWMVGSCLLLLDDAETQSGLGHRAREGHGWQHKEGASPMPAAYQGRSIMRVELGQSDCILPRKRSRSLLALPTGSGLHWGGIPGAATQ